MQRITTLILLFIGISVSSQVFSQSKQHVKKRPVAGYQWHQSYTGGGGYITGLLQHPTDPNVIYARCDVAGVFNSNDGGKSWQAMNSGLKQWYNHSVQSFGISPHNPSVLFRCSGDKRNNTMFGSIHKSKDGGKTWYEVSTEADYYGNGPTRMYGEVIAVDPFDANKVVTASFSKGIFYSTNEGESWKNAGLAGETFISLAYHPEVKNRVYAGALEGNLYQSDDGGVTWKKVFTLPGKGFSGFAFNAKDPNHILASASTEGVWVTKDGGQSFTKVTNGLPEGFQYNTITVDPNNPAIFYTAPDARSNHGLNPIPIYQSVDSGQSWKLLSTHTFDNILNRPSYMQKPLFAGWAISKVRVDVKNPQKLFYSNWYGVYVSEDGGRNWNCNMFKGLETNCLEYIQVDPAAKRQVFYTVADHPPALSRNAGQSYRMLSTSGPYQSSTALVRSKADTAFVLFGMRSKESAGLIRSKNGVTTVVKKFGKGLFVQALQEDPFTKGTFYAFIDGPIDQGAGLYRSTNWGEEWEPFNLNLPAYMHTLPHRKGFIENELLNIVVGQVKNVCGSNQLLCVDPNRKGAIYLGEWTEGIFRSLDGGSTWEKASQGLPFHKDTASVLTVIKADPKRPGTLYAGFIREGLWRSTNYGTSWQKVYPADNTPFNVSSLHVGGITGNELYIACEPLYWGKRESALMYSANQGRTWTDLYDRNYGSLRLKALDVDRQTGRIFIATSGNGAFYVGTGK